MESSNIKVVLIGSSGVGKSAITQRFVDGSYDIEYNCYRPSVGADLSRKTVLSKDQEIVLDIWDTAGQEQFDVFSANYYKDSFGIIIVFDLTDRASFQKANYWYNDINKVKKTTRALSNIHIVIVGNKEDLSERFEITENEIREQFKNEKYFSTSAKTGNNIDEIFMYLADMYTDEGSSKPEEKASANEDSAVSKPKGEKDEDEMEIKIERVNKKKSCC